MNRIVGEARDPDPKHAPVITDPDWYRRTYGENSIPPEVKVEKRMPAVSDVVVHQEIAVVEVQVSAQDVQGQQAA